MLASNLNSGSNLGSPSKYSTIGREELPLFIQTHRYIKCNMSKSQLDGKMRNILYNLHCLEVFGYSNYDDYYWGKIIINNTCVMHFTVTIEPIDSSNSLICITSLNKHEEKLNQIAYKIFKSI